MKKYPECEAVLQKFAQNLENNKDTLLLLARVQAIQDKPEALNSFDLWLSKNDDPLVRYEYGNALVKNDFLAKAVEQYKKAMSGITDKTTDITKPQARFALAVAEVKADPDNDAGMDDMRGAVTDGYKDIDSVRALLDDKKITDKRKDEIKSLIADMMNNKKPEASASATSGSTTSATSGTASTKTPAEGAASTTTGSQTSSKSSGSATDSSTATSAASGGSSSSP
jgi:predicted Zn-dependent protease